MLRLTPLLLFFSGFSALFYQVIWMRLLGLSLGVASDAMAVALASFFLGMSFGGLLSNRLVRNGLYGLKVFALLEFSIAVTALVLLPLLFNLDQLLAALPLLAESTLLKFILATLVLVIPASAIGATYPLLVSSATHNDAMVGGRIAQFYSYNVVGAIIGVLAVAFVAIPAWGLTGATYLAVAINLGVALSALLLSRHEKTDDLTYHGAAQSSSDTAGPTGKTYLIVLGVSGFITLSCEVLWSKYLTMLIGTSIYGFSIMLAAVLTGLATGGFFSKLFMARHTVTMRTLFTILAWLALSLIAMRTTLTEVPVWYEQIRGSQPLTVTAKYLGVLVVVIVPCILLGALYTITMNLYCRDQSGLRRRIGNGFAVNTLFSVAGSVVTGLWLIPAIGSDAAFKWLIAAILLTALILVPQLQASNKHGPFLALLSLSILLSVMPGFNYERVIRSAERRLHDIDTDTFHYTREGRSGMISVVSHGPVNKYLLQRNGLNEAGIDNADPLLGTLTAVLIGTLPAMLQEEPKNIFAVGFGGGTSARLLSTSEPQVLRVAELEPRVLDAMRHINNTAYDFINEPGFELQFNDARHLLNRDRTSYDVIVAQASHPWVSGMANLYSEEYFNIVYSRLSEDGVYLHWVNLFSMDEQILKSVINTFYKVFPKGAVFGVLMDGEMILAGSKQPLVLDRERVHWVLQQDDYKKALNHHGIIQPEDVLQYYLFDRDLALRLSQGFETVTDDNLLTEIGLATMQNFPTSAIGPMPMLLEASSARFSGKGRQPH